MALQKPNNVVALSTKQSRRGDKPSDRLTVFKESKEWNALARQAQLAYEKNNARSRAITHTLSRHGESIDELRDIRVNAIRGTLGGWQALIDEQDEETAGEIRAALEIQRKNELADQLQAHQAGMDTLSETLHDDLQEIELRPGHEWTKRTFTDELDNMLTGGESEMALRGLPPLTIGESVANFFSLGSVAEKRLREHERTRLGAPQTDEDEGVIDADFSSL